MIVEDEVSNRRAEDERLAELTKLARQSEVDLIRTLASLSEFAFGAAEQGDLAGVQEALEAIDTLQGLLT